MNTGFVLVVNGRSCRSKLIEPSQYANLGNSYCEYKPIEKFKNDKLFFEKDGKRVLLDGVIFNKNDLVSGKDTWEKCFWDLEEEDPSNFPNKLRGSFCGFILSDNGECYVFVNQSGEKAAYYYAEDSFFIAASNVRLVHEAMAENGRKIIPNVQGCREMLITGSFLNGNTSIQGVKRVTAGTGIKFKPGEGAKEYRYHMFQNTPEHDMSLEECIDEADRLFRNAVGRIFAKNKEYGYTSEADLSGGLDSRLTSWVAHDLGYSDIINVCYCQKKGLDHEISKKIASDLGNRYYFYPMDDGSILKDVDEVTDVTGGQIHYSLCTGARRTLKAIDDGNIGMCVTGLLGEVHNAYWTEGMTHTSPKYTDVILTDSVLLNVPDEYSNSYENYEQMNLYEFSIPMFLSSAFARQDKYEVYSPFVDVDFLDFVWKVPLKWRKNYVFTMNWYMRKYPDAAKYVWQTYQKPIEDVFYKRIYLPKIIWKTSDFVIKVYNKICKTAGIHSRLAYKTDMNPEQVWWEQSNDIREFFRNYYKQNKQYLPKEVLADTEIMMNSYLCIEKVMVINLCALSRMYFKNRT